jgi:hypothetical protein
MHLSRWAIFFGAAACTAALFQTGDVEARYRVIPQASCVSLPSASQRYACGIPTGSELSAATVNIVEVDVYSSNWSQSRVKGSLICAANARERSGGSTETAASPRPREVSSSYRRAYSANWRRQNGHQ